MRLTETLQKLTAGDEVKIAALGDSLTYGWMTQRGFLDYLTVKLNKKYPASQLHVINRGIPGDTAKDGLRRVNNDIIKSAPDLVLIQFALNDAFTDYSPAEFQRNLESIIVKIKGNSVSEIALLTSVALLRPEENRIALEFYNRIIESGEKFNLPVAAVHEYWERKITSGIKHSILVQSDGIHPTEKGYELMAEAVFELF